MFLGKRGISALVFVLLVFVGQSMASSLMVYKMGSQERVGVMSPSTMADVLTDLDAGLNASLQGGEQKADCCLPDAKCVMGSCSAAALPSLIVNTAPLKLPQSFNHPSAVAPRPALTVLFRPPILR